MPTKTEYREYISSEEWRKKRRWFIEELGHHYCEHCFLPRWLALIAYDEDLHVHHISYARIGEEAEGDLQSLCKRCHEIETFGKSELHEVRSSLCIVCGTRTFDACSKRCPVCKVVVVGGEHNILDCHFVAEDSWTDLLWGMAQVVSVEEILAYLLANEEQVRKIKEEKTVAERGRVCE